MKTTRCLTLFTFAFSVGLAASLTGEVAAYATRDAAPIATPKGKGEAKDGAKAKDDTKDEAKQDPKQDPKPTSKTGIEWKVTPPNVEIWLDGKKLGEAGNLKFTDAKPGKHAVRLTKGGDETEMEVKVSKGEILKFEFDFTDG